MKKDQLTGRRIAVLAADGFEKAELTVPVKALRAAGAKCEIVSLRLGRIRGVNLHEPAGRIGVDLSLDEASPDDYDGLFIPGGFINPDLLRQSAQARAFVRAFDKAGKPIATICHGPWVLISSELLQGRTLTSWPGIRDDVVNAGATWLDQEVVRDGNLVTSRGPQDLVPFCDAIIELYAGMRARRVPLRSAVSAPQRNQPPELMISAMKWLPRPSIRTAGAGSRGAGGGGGGACADGCGRYDAARPLTIALNVLSTLASSSVLGRWLRSASTRSRIIPSAQPSIAEAMTEASTSLRNEPSA
jgi:protease I